MCSSINNLSIFDDFQTMNFKNVESALLASHLATTFLGPQGLLLLTGSLGVFEGGPLNFAFAYHLTKTSLHSMTALMLGELGKTLPLDARVTCLLPGVLDTPSNRASGMPPDDTWIPPGSLAHLILEYSSEKATPPRYVKVTGDPKGARGL